MLLFTESCARFFFFLSIQISINVLIQSVIEHIITASTLTELKCLMVWAYHICAGLFLSVKISNNMFMARSIINCSYCSNMSVNGP